MTGVLGGVEIHRPSAGLRAGTGNLGTLTLSVGHDMTVLRAFCYLGLPPARYESCGPTFQEGRWRCGQGQLLPEVPQLQGAEEGFDARSASGATVAFVGGLWLFIASLTCWDYVGAGVQLGLPARPQCS